MTVFILRPLILQWKKTKIKELKYKFIRVFVLIGFTMQPGIMQMGIEILKYFFCKKSINKILGALISTQKQVICTWIWI